MNIGISELITSLKGQRSYEQLSADCGGAPTGARIQQMVKAKLNVFPSPESIRGLSRGLGIRPSVIISACSVTLGLVSESEQVGESLLLPDVAQMLTPTQRHLIVTMVRELAAKNAPLALGQDVA